MKIYVASSWRNEHQQQVVARLRGLGHEVYDFRGSGSGDGYGSGSGYGDGYGDGYGYGYGYGYGRG